MLRSRRTRRPAGTAAALSLAAALAVSAGLVSAAPRAASAQTAPAPAPVRYAPEGDRQVIFVNNPERLEIDYTDLIPGSKDYGTVFNDLADYDLGGKTILEITVPAGKYRNAFEHVWNFTRKTVPAAAANPLRYAVRVYNPNQTDITVTVRGKGFINNSLGGQPFAEVLNANPAAATTLTVPPGESVFVFRTDVDYAGTSRASIPSGNFFSGVVDFDVEGGKATVSNLAYQNFSDVFFRPTMILPSPFGDFMDVQGPRYMGFITRRYAAGTTPAPETRTYKGLMTYPNIGPTGTPLGGSNAAPGEVGAALTYTIGDATAAGDLPVSYTRYVNDSPGLLNRFTPSVQAVDQIVRSFWSSHTVPIRDTAGATNTTVAANVYAVSNDMYDVLMPEYGLGYSLFQTNTPNTIFGQFNVANWCIVYRHRVTVTNTGTRDRTFALRIQNAGGSSPIAFRDANGVWQHTVVATGNNPFAYRTFTVPAGQTVTAEGAFVLGMPAVGNFRNTVALTN